MARAAARAGNGRAKQTVEARAALASARLPVGLITGAIAPYSLIESRIIMKFLRNVPTAGALMPAWCIALALASGCGGGASGESAPVPAPAPVPVPVPVPVPTPAASVESPGLAYKSDTAFVSGGVKLDDGTLTGFTSQGARAVFIVRLAKAGNYDVNLNYANAVSAERRLSMYVNGLRAASAVLPATGGPAVWANATATLALRAGVNTVSYQFDAGDSGAVAIRYVALPAGLALAERGATLAYEEYEAEEGSSNTAPSASSTDYRTVAAQSSGRRMVALSQAGQYVEWTAHQAANALVVRYNMPDAPSGGGTDATLSLYVDDIKVKSLPLSSHYAWNYGAFPFSDNPADGRAVHLYDESRFSGLNIPAGARVGLQKDGADNAAYYNIDLIDLEQVDAAVEMPPAFVDIRNFGAIADDDGDDMPAVVNAIAAAKAAGKGVWIPPGKFILSGRPLLTDVQVRGAGMWYSELHGIGGKGGFKGVGNNVTVADLTLTSDATRRKDADDNPGFEGDFGVGSLIQNVWIEHMKVGLWLGASNDGLLVVNGRVRNTWADGVNFAGGLHNSAVTQFSFRNTGDDAMAMWSNGAANVGNVFRFNTAQLPMLANAFALYGGTDNKLLDNVGSDTLVSAAGIAISTRFSPSPFAGTTEVRRNTLNRTGGFDPNWNTTFGGLWIYAEGQPISAPIIVDALELNNSTFDAILVSYNQSVTNLSFNNVAINGAGDHGMNFIVTGGAKFDNVTVKHTGGSALNNQMAFTLLRGSGNTGW